MGLARELENSVEHGSDGNTNCNWCYWYNHQRTGIPAGGLENNRTSRDYPNYCIFETVQNTEKSPGDLRSLAVSQTLARNHRLTLVSETRKEVTIIIIIRLLESSIETREEIFVYS